MKSKNASLFFKINDYGQIRKESFNIRASISSLVYLLNNNSDMEIELDKETQLQIKIKALEDKIRLQEILMKTPVIEQPDKALDFVEELSKQLRAEKELETQKAILMAEISDKK